MSSKELCLWYFYAFLWCERCSMVYGVPFQFQNTFCFIERVSIFPSLHLFYKIRNVLHAKRKVIFCRHAILRTTITTQYDYEGCWSLFHRRGRVITHRLSSETQSHERVVLRHTPQCVWWWLLSSC